MQTWLEVKIALVERFGWSLYDIAQTDIEDLMPFVARITREADDAVVEKPRRKGKLAFIDQVDGW